MKMIEITHKKKAFLPLLLLADEQEDMIDRYLPRCRLYAAYDDCESHCTAETALGVCAVTDEGDGVLEIKNLAISQRMQRRGIGAAFISFIKRTYGGSFRILQVGTGDSPLTIPFYESCGFTKAFRVKNFFTDHYDHPIVEAGVLLTDMIYLQMPLDPGVSSDD